VQVVENSGGCKLFSVTGHVQNPANFEVPMGTPFKDLLKILTETSQKTLHRHCRCITKRTDCVTHDFALYTE
jgi:NADH:ubiquinone oxidoreductase subunit F (NADH-binding)